MKLRYAVHAVVALAFSAALHISGCSKSSVGGDVDVDDGTAPATIADLMIAFFTDTSVTLTWTASGDDSASGTATSYDLRISTTIITWADFDSATQIPGLPAPKPAGEPEQFEVRGLKTDSTYYFALRVTDEKGNYEGASNCVSATCFNDFAVNMPDSALRTAVRARIGKPSGDILKSDLLPIFDLPASDQSITDLTGLEYCANLAMLNITNNSVSDLSPLTGLDKLVQLHAGQNTVSDLAPLAGLTGLTILYLHANEITQLAPLAGLTQLTELNLQTNQIIDVAALSGLIELGFLSLSYDRILDILPLVNNPGLGNADHVSLLQNPLGHDAIMVHIPALRARGATVAWIDNTLLPGRVTDLAVDTVTATSVTLSWTAPGEDFDNGTAYIYELRYATTRSVLETWTGGQVASNVPTPDTAGTIQSMVVSGLSEDTAYYFALRTQDNSENWSEVSNIVWAQPFSDEVVVFPDAALDAVIRSAIVKAAGDIYASDLLALDTLVGDNQGISDLTGLEHCHQLRLLNLVNNNITDVGPLAGLVGLYDLNLQGNNIADIAPLSSLENLGILQLSGNPLGDLTVISLLDDLWFLALSFTGAPNLQPLAALSQLRYVIVVGNGISDLTPLASCTHLSYVVADHNAIVDIAVLGGLLELNVVSLKFNSIQDVGPLVGNAGLAAGDQVALEDNPLLPESITIHIPALQARGVTVTF